MRRVWCKNVNLFWRHVFHVPLHRILKRKKKLTFDTNVHQNAMCGCGRQRENDSDEIERKSLTIHFIHKIWNASKIATEMEFPYHFLQKAIHNKY